MPEARDMHRDSILTNFSVKYANGEMLWPYVMPIIKVGKRSDVYYEYNKADSFRLVDDKLGPKSLPNEADWGVAEKNYSVQDHGQGDWLPQSSIDNADNPLQPEIDTNDFLNLLLDVAQEKRVVDKIFAAATYPSGNKTQLTGTAQWGDSADAPVQDVLTAVETCFLRANTLVFGQEAWQKFRALPEILDAVKGSTRQQATPGGLATAAEVMSLFEVETVLVGRAKYITTKRGQTASYSKLWGKHMAALHVAKNPGIKSITFAGTIVEALRATMRDFDKKRGIKGAHYFKVAWNSDEKIIASDLGYFIEDAVA